MKRFFSFFFHELGRVRLGVLLLFFAFLLVPVSHPIHAWYAGEEGKLGTESVFVGALAASHTLTFLFNVIVGAWEAPLFHLFFWGIGLPVLLYVVSVVLFAAGRWMFPPLSEAAASRILVEIHGRKRLMKNVLLFLAVLLVMGMVAEGGLAWWFPTKITKPALLVPKERCIYFSNATFEEPQKGMPVSTGNYVRLNPTTSILASEKKINLFINSSAGIYNIPNCNRTRVAEDGTRLIWYHLNNYGLRMDWNVTLEKKPGQKRVLVLGDSFAFGVGLDQNETVTAIMQGLAGNNDKIEVLNGAIQGLSSLQSYFLYINEYQLLDPDIVIFLHYMNDIPGNLELRRDYFRPVYSIKYNAIQKNKIAEEQENRVAFSEGTHQISRYSHLFSLVDRNRDVFLHRRRVMSNESTSLDMFQAYSKKPIEEMKQALLFNCKVLRLMAKEAQKRNDTFLIAYIPAQIDMDEPYFKRSIGSFIGAELDDFNYQRARKHIEACRDAADLPYLDLTSLFVANTKKKPLEWYNTPGGHWSPQATNLTAHILYEWMKNEGVAS